MASKEKKIVTELSPEEHAYLQAKINTYNYLHGHETRGVCPKCGKYLILRGYVCFGCGYDKSHEDYVAAQKMKEEAKQLNAENA